MKYFPNLKLPRAPIQFQNDKNASEHGQTLAAYSHQRRQTTPAGATTVVKKAYATMSLEEASQKWTQELHQSASELNRVSHDLELKFAAKKSSSGKYVPPFSLWFSRTYRHCMVGSLYTVTVDLINISTHLSASSFCYLFKVMFPIPSS